MTIRDRRVRVLKRATNNRIAVKDKSFQVHRNITGFSLTTVRSVALASHPSTSPWRSPRRAAPSCCENSNKGVLVAHFSTRRERHIMASLMLIEPSRGCVATAETRRYRRGPAAP